MGGLTIASCPSFDAETASGMDPSYPVSAGAEMSGEARQWPGKWKSRC